MAEKQPIRVRRCIEIMMQERDRGVPKEKPVASLVNILGMDRETAALLVEQVYSRKLDQTLLETAATMDNGGESHQ